jgi:hypothetical protein
MKQIALLTASCLSLSACDGGFQFHGRVVSDAEIALTDCVQRLEYGDGKIARGPIPFYPPRVDGGWTVAPFDGTYSLVLSCKGHAPHSARFKYGTDVLPDKDLELGEVRLHFLGSAPNNSFKPKPLRGSA